MEKKTLLVVVLLMVASWGFADGLTFGTKAGINLGFQYATENTLEQNGIMLGYIGMLYLSVPVVGGFSLQTELGFATRGGEAHNENYTDTQILSFLDFPLLARYEIDLKWSRLFLLGGVQGSLCLGGTHYLETSSGSPVTSSEIATKILDIGLVIAAGLDFIIEHNLLTVELRYTLWLLGSYTAKSDRNMALSLLVGYGIKL